MDPVSRRRFLCVSSGCALAAQAAVPRVQAAFNDPVDIGPVSDYSKDEISEKYIKYNFFVMTHKGRLFASTATCPHKGNYLFRSTENPKEILCSGHDAVFDFEGRPVSGRANRPLVRFGIAVDEKGRVRVDPYKEYGEDQWDDPKSFVPLKSKP